MSHVVPILCLLMFVGFVEYRLAKEIATINEEIEELKRLMKL